MAASIQRAWHVEINAGNHADCISQFETPAARTVGKPSRSANLQFAIAILPFTFAPASLFGFSTGKIWQQVSDAVCSAAMNDARLTQFACLVVVLGLFLLWWRK